MQRDDLPSTKPPVPPEPSPPTSIEVTPQTSPEASEPPAVIDWANEAAVVAKGRLGDAEAAEQAAALSSWRSHVMPGPLKRGPQAAPN